MMGGILTLCGASNVFRDEIDVTGVRQSLDGSLIITKQLTLSKKVATGEKEF